MLLVDRQALSEHTTTSSPTESLGQALRVSLVKPGAYLSDTRTGYLFAFFLLLSSNESTLCRIDW